MTDSDWDIGKILLSEYKIKGILGKGGMGTVYLAEQLTSEGNLYAVKTLLTSSITNDKSKRLFLRELRHWVNLPDHPNLVACRFYRTIDDRIAIFSEYVDGGSLQSWIRERKFDSIEKILDVAIQFALGLQILHQKGLIHQDVKPANVLMTSKGICKIADFGLARARDATGVEIKFPSGFSTVMVSSSGMTVAYCSPEQAAGGKLNRKTDIWSYGVSIMEIFKGDVTWTVGSVAGAVLDMYLESGSDSGYPAMPDKLVKILYRCFHENQEKRWDSMAEIVTALIDIYREETGHQYSRKSHEIKPEISKKPTRYERVTERGIKWDDPAKWLKRAYSITGKDLSDIEQFAQEHSESKKTHELFDLELYEEAQQIFIKLITDGRNDLEEEFTDLLRQKALVQNSTDDLEGALKSYNEVIKILENIIHRENRSELWEKLDWTIGQKAILQSTLGDNFNSLKSYDEAISIREKLVYKDNRKDLILDLAMMYSNKGLSEKNLGNLEESLELFDRGISICKKILSKKGDKDASIGLARMYTNKAVTIWKTGKLAEASDLYDHSIKIWIRLMKNDNRVFLENEIALVYMNKAIVQRLLGNSDSTLELYDKAIDIREKQVYQDGLWHSAEPLAKAYMNKANFYFYLQKIPDAIELHDKAISIRKQLIFNDGRHELFPNLVWIYMNKANALNMLEKYDEALNLYDEGIDIVKRLIKKKEGEKHLFQLGWIYRNKALTYYVLEDYPTALNFYDKALDILHELAIQKKQKDHMSAYWDVKIQRANLLAETNDIQTAKEELEESIKSLEEEIDQSGAENLKKILQQAKGYLDRINSKD